MSDEQDNSGGSHLAAIAVMVLLIGTLSAAIMQIQEGCKKYDLRLLFCSAEEQGPNRYYNSNRPPPFRP